MRYGVLLLCFLILNNFELYSEEGKGGGSRNLLTSLAGKALSFTDDRAKAIDSLEYPDQFHIRQDRSLRMFHILTDKQFLGVVVNSDWGIFDFYNNRKKKEYVNREDSLYDRENSCVGFIQFTSYKEWFSRSSNIEIYSTKGELLATLVEEKDEKSFVFYDAETQEPMAIAFWSQTRMSSYSPTGSRYPLQDWSVRVINRVKLQEKKIPFVFLVWTLLKHSQRFFPSREECKHEVDFEQDNQLQHTTTADPLFEMTLISFPEEFHIQQDPVLHLFRVSAKEKLLSVVVNSKAGKFDFYDSQKRRQGTARADSLYENSGHCMGFVKLKSDSEWLPPKSNHIKILSDDDTLLATMESEGDPNYFVFRDAETQEALVIAKWNCIIQENTYFPWLTGDYVQDWTITILNPLRLQEKEIPTILLVWTLLKHSEKYLPWSWICEYWEGPPPD